MKQSEIILFVTEFFLHLLLPLGPFTLLSRFPWFIVYSEFKSGGELVACEF